MVAVGVGVGQQACPIVLNMFSFFFLGMESHVPGVAGYDLGGPVSPGCMDASHHLIFTSKSTVSVGRRHLNYPCKKLHSGLRIQAIFIVNTRLKQDAKIGLLVVRSVVWLSSGCSALRIWEFSNVQG